MKIIRNINICVLVAVIATMAGCGVAEFDNYDPPEAQLNGAVVHEGDTIRVRDNAVELEIWQDGYEDYEKIPVYVSQDGTFAAKLFEGTYKFTQLINSGPWVNNSDTTEFTMNGDNLNYEFEVTPYVKFTDSDIRLEDNAIVADFSLEQVTPPLNGDYAWVTLWIGTGQFVSSNLNQFWWNQDLEANYPNPTDDLSDNYIIDFNGQNTYSSPLSALPASLADMEYVFARVEVVIVGKQHSVYSRVHKIQLAN